MAQIIGDLRRWFDAGWDWAARMVRIARRRPWFDHLARAYERYSDRRGDRLAAAMTYFGFLSFFPLLALAYALLGYLVGVSAKARELLVASINSLLPGLARRLPLEDIAQAKTAAGIIGLVGLLLIGLGWVGVLRESLREIFGNAPTGGGNFFVKKFEDTVLLFFLGTVLLLSVAVSTISDWAGHQILGYLGIANIPGMGLLLQVVTLAVAIGCNTLIFLVMFDRLSGTRSRWRGIRRGALFGAVGFEVLKMIATLLVARTTRNPVYASVTVVAALLVWIDFASRYTLFAAAWTATRSAVLDADTGDTETAPLHGEGGDETQGAHGTEGAREAEGAREVSEGDGRDAAEDGRGNGEDGKKDGDEGDGRA